MLQKKAVKETTFSLLKELMNDPKLKKFHLAGGTALALYLGHRISIDLDLFSLDFFDAKELERHLIHKYNFRSDFIEQNTLKGAIRGIKIDCITHKYPLVEKLKREDGIRVYGAKDIVAMKLSAIADNGTRLKDFIDIAFLSTKLTLSEMLGSYKSKYKQSNPITPLRALVYYDDINFNEPVQMLIGDYKWEKIEHRIKEMIQQKNRQFLTTPITQKRKGLRL